MSILDDRIAHPGLYIGVDDVQGRDLRGVARMMISVLPGRVGVTLDYELLNAEAPGPVRGHVEHTLVARAHDGQTIMVIADTQAGSLTMMRETANGVFQPSHPVPYPMKVVLSTPEPGRLRHAWWYGGEDGPVERDVSTLRRADQE